MIDLNNPIDLHIINVDKRLYVDAEYVYEYLKEIFEEIKDDVYDDIVTNIEHKIDILLEKIEFNEWEWLD